MMVRRVPAFQVAAHRDLTGCLIYLYGYCHIGVFDWPAFSAWQCLTTSGLDSSSVIIGRVIIESRTAVLDFNGIIATHFR